MEMRPVQIRRVLMLVVGVVCCYVLFYNSLMLDRRPFKRLITGRLMYPVAGSPTTYTVAGANHSSDTSQLLRAASSSTGTFLSSASEAGQPGLRQLEGIPSTPEDSKREVINTDQTTTGRQSKPPVQSSSNSVVSPSVEERRIPSSTGAATRTTSSSSTTRATTTRRTTPVEKFKSNASVIENMYESGFRIANEDLCPDRGGNQLVVILITTAPSHDRHRRAIRQTWGTIALRRDVSLAFVVGRTTDTLQRLINAEQALYGDMIQTNVIDAYKNLTLKSVAMMEWLGEYCPEARIILKTDDDMFINTDNLLSFARIHRLRQNTVFGRLGHRWKPIRNTKSKYYLAPNIYPGKYLPDFMTGPAYVLTGDLVNRMHSESLRTPFVPLEDVLMTGVVGEKVKLKRVHAREFINDRIRIDTCKLQTAISIHMVKFEEQFDMWKRVSDGRTKCPRAYKPTGV